MNKTIKRMYHSICSRTSPRFSESLQHLVWVGHWPNLENPRTYNERIRHRKLYDHDERYPPFTDKIQAKVLVEKLLGKKWIIPTIWFGRVLPKREDRLWGGRWVIKSNCASGWNILVKDGAPDWHHIEHKCSEWLSKPWHPSLHEWAYSRIIPMLLVEPYVGNPDSDLIDYKFHCFNGTPEYVGVHVDRSTAHKYSFFDMEWNMRFKGNCPGVEPNIAKPHHLSDMIAAAKLLSKGFSYVRVDLYDLQRPLFGEMTFYPGSGTERFLPRFWDRKLGDIWGGMDTSRA